jgi:hypothetical protein
LPDTTTSQIIKQGSFQAFADMAYPSGSMVNEFDDVDLALAANEDLNDVGFLDSTGAAFMQEGLITGGFKASNQFLDRAQMDTDAGFEATSLYDTDESFRKRLDPLLQDSIRNERVLSQVGRARSAQEALYFLDQHDKNEEAYLIAQANGVAPVILGTVAGIGLDIGAAIVAGLASQGAGAPAMFGELATLGARFRRLEGAAKLGALGALEGGAERAVQMITDNRLSEQDVMLGAAIGLVFGGGLGAALPGMAGVAKKLDPDITKVMTLDEADAIIGRAKRAAGEFAEEEAGSVPNPLGKDELLGPRREVPVEDALPHKTGGTLLVDTILGRNAFVRTFLRSPKRVMADIGVEADRLRELGYNGQATAFLGLNRLVTIGVKSVGEVAGRSVRQDTVQDVVLAYERKALALDRAIDKDYADWIASQGTGSLNQFVAGGSRGDLGRFAQAKLFDGLDAGAYERLVDDYRQAITQQARDAADDEVADKFVMDPDKLLDDDVLANLSEEGRTALLASLDKSSARIEKFYQDFGELEVARGVIQPEELIPGYTPQIWSREKITADRARFELYLAEVFGQTPDESWLRRNFAEVADETADAPAGSVKVEGIRPEETLDSWLKRDPPTFRQARDQWDTEIAEGAQKAADGAASDLSKELSKLQAKSLAEVEARYAKANEVDTTNMTKAQDEMDALLANKKGRAHERQARALEADALNVRIAKLEKKINDRNSRLRNLKKANLKDVEGRQLLQRVSKKQTAKDLKDLAARAVRAAGKAEKVHAADVVSEQVRKVTQAIIDGDTPFGLIPEGFKVNSSRFKRRSIHLGRMRFDKRFDEFAFRDQAAMRRGTAKGVGAQLAVRELFGLSGDTINKTELLDKIVGDFEADKALATQRGDKKALKLLKKREQETKALATHLLKETLGDFDFGRGMGKELEAAALAATSAMSLGKISLSQFTDLAVTMLAGGQLATGITGLGRNLGKILKEIRSQEDLADLLIVLEGFSTANGRRVKAYSEINRGEIDVPGGKLGMVRRVAENAAMVEAWANLMHVMNRKIRGSFGIDFANQIHKHATKGWDSLRPSLQAFYRRQGIGPDELGAMGREFQKGTRKIAGGKVSLPDPAKWDPDVLANYENAMQRAGDESMLDPGVGDRPFARAHPGGRILMQFQSFVFTAADRYVAPLIQEIRLHPTELRAYTSIVTGWGLATLADGIRQHIAGRGEEWRDNWERPDGVVQNLTAGFLRSPMAAGGMSMVHEGLTTQQGSNINDVLEGTLGGRFVREAPTKFMEEQGLLGLLGPSMGNLNTLMSIARGAPSDPQRAAERLLNRLPVANTIIPQLIMAVALDKVWK